MLYNSSQYGLVELPIEITNQYKDSKAFVEHIFSPQQLAQESIPLDFFKSQAILSPWNNTAALFNAQILGGLHGEAKHYHSSDTSNCNNGANALSVEFLQTLEPSGFPPADLYVKVGAPIMLLQNLHPPKGMCKGTQLIITRLHRDCIEGRV